MINYSIFVKAPINYHKTYFQNARRGERAIHVEGKEAMVAMVKELKAAGEVVLSVRTALGGWVNVSAICA